MAAFVDGLVVFGGHLYFVMTGVLLATASIMMVSKCASDDMEHRPVEISPTD